MLVHGRGATFQQKLFARVAQASWIHTRHNYVFYTDEIPGGNYDSTWLLRGVCGGPWKVAMDTL